VRYQYSELNRLQYPISYMYSSFQGLDFLQAYTSNRKDYLKMNCAPAPEGQSRDLLLVNACASKIEALFYEASEHAGSLFNKVLTKQGVLENLDAPATEVQWTGLRKSLDNATASSPIVSLDLLNSLIYCLLNDVQNVDLKFWVDKLVQRFEVTKKIYEWYSSELRRGGGDNTSVRHYWLLAIVLSLYYARSQEIKYLNTLLKISDLLCSLPQHALSNQVSKTGLALVLITELVSVQLIAEVRGVQLATQ
jgi:hypothetical protein